VSAVVHDGAGFQIEISGSPTVGADAVVLAVPPDRAARLLPPGTGFDATRVLRLGSSPIVNLHVVYDRRVFDAPFAAAVGSPVQWIFDRTESSGAAGGQYLVVSLSAADAEISSSVDDLRSRYLPALAGLLDDSAKVDNFFVTREHAATFRAAPGTRSLRPSAKTALPGFALAGSWTDTGWPATMEGAVRSGHAAARVALESLTGKQLRRAAHGERTEQSAVRSPELTILAPMALEAKALRSGAPWARVERIGAGPALAPPKLDVVVDDRAHPVLVAGLCGAIDERLEPGDVVLATELRAAEASSPCPDPTILANVLRRGGLRVWTGPIASTTRVVAGAARARMATTGAIAVDMESAFVTKLTGRSIPVMRVVLDTSHSELYRPLRTARGTAHAYRTLRRAAALLVDWALMFGPREVILATPRASCAGVERAVQIVERTLEQDGPPVYVRKQIVHNSHVISDLESRGAVFVDEVEQVPPGATVIFSAHGVAPEVRTRARERGLRVLDATCPLVSKVHAEARRFRDRGYDIVLVGHEGHEEVDGTLGQAPERTHIIAGVDEVEQVHVDDPARVAYLTQTTLALDDTADVIEALRGRFPELAGPPSSDICYATQNRQDAVRAVAADCDLLLVIGSKNSSNSQRLVEVAGRAGARAVLIEDGGDLTPALLAGARRIGVSAGASAPEKLVGDLVAALSGLGEVTVSERRVAREDMHFKLPVEVRGKD
jgi:4-hydroxy-3-methylbut-2-enyl diphosphate reductase